VNAYPGWQLPGLYAANSSSLERLLPLLTLLGAASALADEAGGEASLKLPDLSQVTFLGIDGHKLLLFGIVICIFGLGFGWRSIRG